MNIEDRVRDAYTLVDDWGPAVAPPLRRSVRRTARRRVLRLAVPLTAVATVSAGILVAAAVDTAPSDRTQKPSHSASAGSAPGVMSPIAMMRPERDDQVQIFLCNFTANSYDPNDHWCHRRSVTPAERAAIARDLKKRADVRDSVYVSPRQAYARAKKRFAHTEIGDALQVSDFPASFTVTVRRSADDESIVRAFTGKPGVYVVLTRISPSRTP
ncbi:hypothetical protein GCM10023191_074990 [Actinoallomurus oryzae]|uniref:FtsX extracellular domain-containing protein n=1 Tax=Actinoallomurus oryzae TaxID=502180 RepID=A0ABP8QVK8_9ACTN